MYGWKREVGVRHSEVGGRGQQSRNAGSLQAPKKLRKRSPLELLEETQPCRHLEFRPQTPFQLLTSRTIR